MGKPNEVNQIAVLVFNFILQQKNYIFQLKCPPYVRLLGPQRKYRLHLHLIYSFVGSVHDAHFVCVHVFFRFLLF